MFSSKDKENNVYLCKPQFYYIKVGFKGSKLYSITLQDCALTLLALRLVNANSVWRKQYKACDGLNDGLSEDRLALTIAVLF